MLCVHTTRLLTALCVCTTTHLLMSLCMCTTTHLLTALCVRTHYPLADGSLCVPAVAAVHVWGSWDQTGQYLCQLHHHEPGLRRPHRAARQPAGPVQAHSHDGTRLPWVTMVTASSTQSSPNIISQSSAHTIVKYKQLPSEARERNGTICGNRSTKLTSVTWPRISTSTLWARTKNGLQHCLKPSYLETHQSVRITINLADKSLLEKMLKY